MNKFYIDLFINDLVKKFRLYNDDCFKIKMEGLANFIDKTNDDIKYLVDSLNLNNFELEFTDDNKGNIDQIVVKCENRTKDSLYDFIYPLIDLQNIMDLASKTSLPVIVVLIMKIIGRLISKLKVLYKAIVLDLDDTLWMGTLAEDKIDKIKENMHSSQAASFINFMKFVKNLAQEFGIYVAICSKNDIKLVEEAIRQLDEDIFPLKNQIDCIVANDNDKSKNIQKIAEELSILTKSIVFVDDNPISRDEVKTNLPEVFVPNWTNHEQITTQILIACIFERLELSKQAQNKRKTYKILQVERSKNSLASLDVKLLEDFDHTESIKFYYKTNQFKFSNIEDSFDEDAKSIYFEMYRGNDENLGICSVMTYKILEDTFFIYNWAISCRFYEIGLEEFVLLYLHKVAGNNRILINYHKTEDNRKVTELLNKYPSLFKENKENKTNKKDKKNKKNMTDKTKNVKNVKEIVFTENILENIRNKTNLRMI